MQLCGQFMQPWQQPDILSRLALHLLAVPRYSVAETWMEDATTSVVNIKPFQQMAGIRCQSLVCSKRFWEPLVRLAMLQSPPPPSPVIIVITHFAFVCMWGFGFSAQCNPLLVYLGSLVVPRSFMKLLGGTKNFLRRKVLGGTKFWKPTPMGNSAAVPSRKF